MLGQAEISTIDFGNELFRNEMAGLPAGLPTPQIGNAARKQRRWLVYILVRLVPVSAYQPAVMVGEPFIILQEKYFPDAGPCLLQ